MNPMPMINAISMMLLITGFPKNAHDRGEYSNPTMVAMTTKNTIMRMMYRVG
jgi:hypothetical protein